MTSSISGPQHVWLDGALLPAGGPHVSAFDRGIQLGDGVFETLRVRGGRPTEFAEHVARLTVGAAALEIPLDAEAGARIEGGIAALLAAEGLGGPDGDASVRVTLTRGSASGRGLLPPVPALSPTMLIQAWPVVPIAAELLERGLAVVTSRVRRDPESPLAGIKTTSRADHVLARLEARRAGADDAVFLTIDGFLSEATSANLFLVRTRDGLSELATPDLSCAILAGTTRTWILAWAPAVGLTPLEGWLTTRDLVEADEAFLSSSVAGVIPLTSLDGRPVGDGLPGPWTRRARADREAAIAGRVG